MDSDGHIFLWDKNNSPVHVGARPQIKFLRRAMLNDISLKFWRGPTHNLSKTI
jgi:hypothetical protein